MLLPTLTLILACHFEIVLLPFNLIPKQWVNFLTWDSNTNNFEASPDLTLCLTLETLLKSFIVSQAKMIFSIDIFSHCPHRDKRFPTAYMWADVETEVKERQLHFLSLPLQSVGLSQMFTFWTPPQFERWKLFFFPLEALCHPSVGNVAHRRIHFLQFNGRRHSECQTNVVFGLIYRPNSHHSLLISSLSLLPFTLSHLCHISTMLLSSQPSVRTIIASFIALSAGQLMLLPNNIHSVIRLHFLYIFTLRMELE